MVGINPFYPTGGDGVATKKDYERVAKALNRALREYRNGGNKVPTAFAHKVITSIADEFAVENGNFNRTTFYNTVVKD